MVEQAVLRRADAHRADVSVELVEPDDGLGVAGVDGEQHELSSLEWPGQSRLDVEADVEHGAELVRPPTEMQSTPVPA